MLVSTQGIKFTEWATTFSFYRTHFTEANGGQDQLTPLYSGTLNRVVKDFVLLDQNKDAGSPVLMAQVDEDGTLQFNLDGDKDIAAPYPLDAENVYDVDGNVVSTEQYTTIKLGDVSHEASRRQFQMQPQSDANFLALIFSEGSLKLVQAELVDADKKPRVEYKWSTLVVPQVKEYTVDANTYDAILSGEYNEEILVIVTLDKKQKAAFEATHPGITLNFQHMERVPFVLSFDKTGKLLGARNVVNVDFKAQDSLHLSGVDLRDNKLLVVGNTFPTSGLYFNTLATHAYVSVVDLSLLTADATTTQVLNLLHDRDASLGFVVRDAVFAPDGQSTDIFIFAGDVQLDNDNLYNVEARLILSDGQRSNQQVLVGESGANVVRSLTRYNTAGQDESVICDLYMDAPTSPPEHPDKPQEDPFRKVNAGFWQVDCSTPNHTLENAAYGLFFSVVGLGMFVFVTAVSAFSVICVFDLKEKRRAKKRAALEDEEATRLIN